MNNTHLKIKGLWHHYGSSSLTGWALKSFNLELKRGELIGLLGPSGCGKTTLLRLIAGFEKPCKGSISIDDVEVATPNFQLPPERRGIGMVFQDYALFPHLDAWRNVCFGLKRGSDKSRAIWLLELLGLIDLRNRYPHQLSGGQRQRLALARALAPGTSLVLLDEPFSNLDVEVRLRLRTELSSVLRTCGASGLLVTHDPQEALAISDRVAVLQDGELHQCSTPSELVLRPSSPFVGRFVLQRNVLPVELGNNEWNTPLGSLIKPKNFKVNSNVKLMVDEQALEIQIDSNGHGKVQGKEFLGNCWLIRANIGDIYLRVRLPIDQHISVGDRCSIKFRKGEHGILFPGAISCEL